MLCALEITSLLKLKTPVDRPHNSDFMVRMMKMDKYICCEKIVTEKTEKAKKVHFNISNITNVTYFTQQKFQI